MKLLQAALAAALALFAPPVIAQNAPTATVRGAVETVAADGAGVNVRTRAGEERTIRLDSRTRYTFVVPAALADVKPGAFIGVAAMPGEGDELKAMEVHIFPEAMRGTGEGHRPFDLAPGSSMTNGAVAARVEGVAGPKLTVTYKGGQKIIVIDSRTPIVTFEPATEGDLKPGAAIVVRGTKQDDGSVAAAFMLIGKDGFTPPL